MSLNGEWYGALLDGCVQAPASGAHSPTLTSHAHLTQLTTRHSPHVTLTTCHSLHITTLTTCHTPLTARHSLHATHMTHADLPPTTHCRTCTPTHFPLPNMLYGSTATSQV